MKLYLDTMFKMTSDSEYYVKILDQQMMLIFKTQLLVDEDQLMINEYWHVTDPQLKYDKLKVILFSAGAIGMIIGMGMGSLQTIAASVIPVAIKSSTDLYRKFTHHMWVKNFDKLASSLKKQFDINVGSYHYFQRRSEAIYKLRTVTDTNTVTELLRCEEKVYGINISINLKQICLELQQAIAILIGNLSLGPGSYAYLINYDLTWDIVNSDAVDIHTVINNFNKLYNLYILMSSGFLSCLSLSLCFTARSSTKQFVKIQRNVIAKLKTVIGKLVAENEIIFDALRYHLGPKEKVPRQRFVRVVKSHYIHSQLQECMRNMQLTFELSHHLCATVELEENPNVYEVHRFLMDLRAQAAIVNENIGKLLLTSSRVVAKTNRLKAIPELIKPTLRVEEEFVGENQVIRHDDPPVYISAEEYEAYIKEGELGPPPDMMFETDDVEELQSQLTAQKQLIAELRQRLQEMNAGSERSKLSINEDESSIDSSASLMGRRLDRLSLMDAIGCRDLPSDETSTSGQDTSDTMGDDGPRTSSESETTAVSYGYSRSSVSEAVASAARLYNRQEETFGADGGDSD